MIGVWYLFGRFATAYSFKMYEPLTDGHGLFILFSVISQCIQLLVSDLEGACEPALITMAKVNCFLLKLLSSFCTHFVLSFLDGLADMGISGRSITIRHVDDVAVQTEHPLHP